MRGTCVLKGNPITDGPEECTVSWVRCEDYVSIKIVGLLNFNVIESFSSVVARAMEGFRGPLLIDLQGTKGMDSTGFGSLLRLRGKSPMVLLVRPRAFVRKQLAVTRLNTLFEVCESLDEAKGKIHEQNQQASSVPTPA